MEHTESKIKVYQTRDYSRFTFIDGNRPLNDSKIKKIIKDIESGIDVLRYYPIQVYEFEGKLGLQDGQHRFKIAKVLGKPVHYIVMDQTLHLSEIAKVNSLVEPWRAKDFINCYIKNQNKNYQQLKDFIDKYGVSITVAVQLLKDGEPSSKGIDSTEAFQRGEFKVEHWNEAVAFADTVSLFKAFDGWKSRSFFVAIHKIMMADKVKMKELATKVNKCMDKLSHQDSFKGYIENLESIYNLGRKERVIIF